MSTFEINDSVLHRECVSIAQEIFDDVTGQNPGDNPENLRDDMDEQAHETADGHEWVIYSHKALMLCAHCDTQHGDDFLDDVGMPEDPDLYKIACLIAYGEMRGRIMAAIEDLIADWEPSEDLADVSETQTDDA